MQVTIFGRTKPVCVWCDRAKQFCLDRNLDFVFKDISTLGVKDELFSKAPGVKTVPQIFIDELHIGGYEEFAKHIMNKENET